MVLLNEYYRWQLSQIIDEILHPYTSPLPPANSVINNDKMLYTYLHTIHTDEGTGQEIGQGRTWGRGRGRARERGRGQGRGEATGGNTIITILFLNKNLYCLNWVTDNTCI